MEYLCLEKKVQEGEIHTELACLYAQYINTLVVPYEESGNMHGAEADKNILELRKKLMSFFELSSMFDTNEVIPLLHPKMMLKEKAMLMAKEK